jgi:hypothetical protein
LELPFPLQAAADRILQTIQPLGRNVRCSPQLADGSRIVRFDVPVGRWGLNLAAVELRLSEGLASRTYVRLSSIANEGLIKTRGAEEALDRIHAAVSAASATTE